MSDDTPQINGLRPSLGPSTGGTTVTIRGSNLGISEADVIDVVICNVSVRDTLKYFSQAKLQVTTKACDPDLASGRVVVTTSSGGVGVSAVPFVVEKVILQTKKKEIVGPLEASEYWVDEQLDMGHLDMAPAATMDRDPLNLLRQDQQMAASGFSQSQLTEAEGSALMSDKTFNAAMCLSRTYSKVTLSQLKQGLEHIREQQTTGLTAYNDLLNGSASTFIAAYEGVSRASEKIKFHQRTAQSRSLTHPLTARLNKLLDLTQVAYGEILKRHQDAEKNSDIINVLSAHRFLFNLPRSLRDLIAKESWTQVILDLNKARELFREDSASSFQPVIKNVETIAEEVRLHLSSQLSIMPAALQEMSTNIDLLSTLDSRRDYAWICIQHINTYANKVVDDAVTSLATVLQMKSVPARRRWSQVRALVKMGGLGKLVHSSDKGQVTSTVALESWNTSSFSDVRTGGASASAQLSVLQARQRIENADTPPRVLLAERVISVLLSELPKMWQLMELWYPGFDDDGGDDGSAAIFPPAKQRRRSHMFAAIPGAFTKQNVEFDFQRSLVRHSQVKDCIESLIRKGTKAISENLIAISEAAIEDTFHDGAARVLLPQLAARLFTCCKALDTTGIPSQLTSPLYTVLADLSTFAMKTVFQLADKEVQQLANEEDWIPLEGEDHTRLPVTFENIVRDALECLEELNIQQEDETREMLETLYCKTLGSYLQCLQQLLKHAQQATPNTSITSLVDRTSPHREAPHRLMEREERTTQPHMLLCVISNVSYTRDVATQSLVANFDDLHVDLGTQFALKMEEFLQLQRQCVDAFVEISSSNLVSQVEMSLPIGLTSIPDEHEVRPYIKEVILQIILLNDTIARTAKSFLKRILCAVVDRLGAGTLAILKACDFKSAKAANQVLLEVHALKKVLASFDTSPTVWQGALSLLNAKRVALSRRGPKSTRRLPTPGAAPTRRSLPTPGVGQPSTSPTEPPPELLAALSAFYTAGKYAYQSLELNAQDTGIDSDSDVEV
eukprot:m.276626 g.276626  ORF g.276626 m.276626 type:complete len:1016 (-) comp15713_c2_seq6:2052-5099(-)